MINDCCRADTEMGIRGLTAFIDSHTELLTDFRLHDTRIIIDGNNLYHFLYYHFRVPCEYGGDYSQFAQNCDTFFAALRLCNVTAYVVFDGAYAADGIKFQTSLARARERVHMSNIVAHGRHAKILPILTHLCFVRVLQKLDVEYVTCEFEADRQIAALARHWNCPVLTNDSDFFIYDIPAGVVLLDYLNFRARCQHGRTNSKQSSEVVYRYFESQVFYCQKFMKFLCVNDHPLVVLFATLLGNDIVDRRNFEDFFSHVRIPKAHGRAKSGYTDRKIAGLITWLQSVSSVTNAVSFILSKLPQTRRKSVQLLIELSLECFLEPSSDLHKYFETERHQNKHIVKTLGECVLPGWFQASIVRGLILSPILNVLATQRVLLQSQIELSSEASSYKCSLKLRQMSYGIALSSSTVVDSSSCCAVCVNEYDRECKTLNVCPVEPVIQLNGKCLPCLSEVAQIDRRHRFLLLLEALDTNIDRVFDLLIPEVQFLVAVLRYWVRHATPKISSLHVHALLLCLLKLGSLDTYLLVAPQSKSVMEAVQHSAWILQMNQPQFISDLTVTEDEDFNLFTCIVQSLAAGLNCIFTDEQNCAVAQENESRKHEIHKIKEKLVKFESPPHHNHAVVYNSAIVYAFAEFQTCYMSAVCLASLLGLLVQDPASVFSGTLLYNLMKELESRSNPDAYVTELLGGTRSVPSSCYFQLMSVIFSDMPSEHLELVGCCAKKKNRRGKKNSKKASTDLCDMPNSSLQNDRQIADDNTECYIVSCDTDNRFSNLSVVDE